mgnify:CR=1 FL=1
MMENELKLTQKPAERAFLVGAEIKNQPGLLSIADSLEELRLLSETAGLEVVGETSQKLDAIFDDFRLFVKMTEKLSNAKALLKKEAENFDWENLD